MKRHNLQKWPLGIDSVYSLMRAGATCLGQGTPFFAEGLGLYARAALSLRLSKSLLTANCVSQLMQNECGRIFLQIAMCLENPQKFSPVKISHYMLVKINQS